MRTRSALEARPEELWRLIEPLRQRLDAGRRLAAVHVEALAEAYFRIGVHRDTTPATALDVLARAHRLDTANPKHPYHLGLLHLRHGQPEAAVSWLTAAAALSPVNHRVRAHLSLAHRELDAVRQGAAGYDNENRAEAERIAEAVRAGVDAFETGQSTLALIRPGSCRWSGIHDLEADAGLRGRTAERAREALAAQLQIVAELAARRPGGTAAFTVLAVQWMVFGYPPATIRRLARLLPPGDGPSTRLLESVCELFECDRAELPSRLAACLVQRSMPDPLIALIHSRRLFWRPLRFPDLGVHAAAREFTEGDPARHVKALEAAWRELSVEPPEPLADVPDRTSAARSATTTPDAQLAVFEQAASGLADLRSEIRAQIKALGRQAPDSESNFARVAGDRDLLVQLVDGLEGLRGAWLADLQRFKEVEPDGLAMEFGEFQRRLENCESAYQEAFRNLLTLLKKTVERPLEKARSTYGSAVPSPSRQATELAERFAAQRGLRQPTNPAGDAEESSSGPASHGPAAHRRIPPPAAQATARERVAHALAAAEQALAANYAEAWQTLEAYPPALRHRDALVLLRGYLGGRQAEAEFRLGRPDAARRRWTALLADDPVRPAVLHNLAVAHTSAGDPAPAAEAWSRYVDATYLRDLLNGDVRRGAAARARLHRILAGSFGTAPLCTALIPDEGREETEQQIPALLARRAKVALVAAHLRLEELNHTYAHRSPTVLLGIERNDAAPAEARERRATALGAAVLGLPPRIRGPFEKECLHLLDEARDEAGEAQGRVRRPGDEAEESAHAAWVQDRVRWKFGILSAITDEDADWQLTECSGAVIANLRLFDELTLDPSDAMLVDCLRQFRPNDDPDKLIELLDHLSLYAAQFAFGEILAAAETAGQSPVDARTFAESFRRIGRSWGRNPVPEHVVEGLDDPVELYAEAAKQALEIVGRSESPDDDGEREIVIAALPVLEGWSERLPGATGPARALARLLGALGHHDEALKVLTRAGAEAFSSVGRKKVLRARALLDILRGEFAAAVSFLRHELADDMDDEQLKGLLTSAFDRWIGSTVNVPSPETITEAFAPWTDEKTVRDRRVLLLNAALANSETPAGETDAGALVRTLREIVAADPDHVEAHIHLSDALIGQAKALRDQMVRTAGAARKDLHAQMAAALTECEQRTDALLPRLEDEKYARHRERLAEILETVRAALR